MNGKRVAYGLPYPTPSSDHASQAMRRVRRSDTAPERALRSALHRLGFRFRKDYRITTHRRTLRADIVFPTERLAVFVDGCFWHRCPEHGTMPESNRNYWEPKLNRNVERDTRTNEELRCAGWDVVRIWEHIPLDEAVLLVSERLKKLRAQETPKDRKMAPA